MKLKLIDGYTNYFVSDTGKIFSTVRSVEPIELSIGLHITRHTEEQEYYYYVISLCKEGKGKTFYVHHLVASAFLPPKPFPEAIIRHLNGDSLNNNANNLAWGNWKEDAEDRKRCGTISRGKLTPEQIREIRSSHLTGVELSKLFNRSKSVISMIKSGKRYKE